MILTDAQIEEMQRWVQEFHDNPNADQLGDPQGETINSLCWHIRHLLDTIRHLKEELKNGH